MQPRPLLASQIEMSSLVLEFRGLAIRLAELGRSENVLIRPFHDPTLPLFSALPPELQKRGTDQLRTYVSICEDVLAGGDSLRSSSRFVWRALGALGLIPDASLFQLIEDDDVIEIYNTDNIQIFRNLRFFEFCSYTLEQLFSKPWTDLFIREEPLVTERLLHLLNDLISSRKRAPIATQVGTHFTRESGSERNFRVELDVKHLALLFNESDEPQAFISCEKARLA